MFFTSCRRFCCTSCVPLLLKNTFKKVEQAVIINGVPVYVSSHKSGSRLTGSAYCCGPTVYDECHVGHAFAFIRFDLLRRALATYCNTDIITCIGVTDIDDKILNRAVKEDKDWKTIATHFYQSFRDDMRRLNCLPAHKYLKVTDHVDHIIEYVKTLESNGYAYINEHTSDVVLDTGSVSAYPPASEDMFDNEKAIGKKDHRDFVLWKRVKPGEPFFEYKSPSGRVIPGRPGWHVECSAMLTAAFGPLIDFHFGGKDLIQPHHFNESVCCFAHSNQKSNDRNDLFAWCNHWIHSGHLVIKTDGETVKMSKSLGNIITISEFLKSYDSNILRIICLRTHSRTDIVFDDDLIEMALKTDLMFKRLLHWIHEMSEKSRWTSDDDDRKISRLVGWTEAAIIAGVSDDLSFPEAITAISDMFNILRQFDRLSIVSVTRVRFLIETFLAATGLQYGQHVASATHDEDKLKLANMLTTTRDEVRQTGVSLLKQGKKSDGQKLLKLSDDMRQVLNEAGVLVKDPVSGLK